MENAGYFFAAYAVIWAFVFGYVLFMAGRQKSISKQLAALEEEKDRDE